MTYSAEEIDGDRNGVGSGKKPTFDAKLTVLLCEAHQLWAHVLSEGEYPMGYFTEQNTLLNTRYLPQVLDSLSQEAAWAHRGFAFNYGLHHRLHQLGLVSPTVSKFLSDPAAQLVTSVRGDKSTYRAEDLERTKAATRRGNQWVLTRAGRTLAALGSLAQSKNFSFLPKNLLARLGRIVSLSEKPVTVQYLFDPRTRATALLNLDPVKAVETRNKLLRFEQINSAFESLLRDGLSGSLPQLLARLRDYESEPVPQWYLDEETSPRGRTRRQQPEQPPLPGVPEVFATLPRSGTVPANSNAEFDLAGVTFTLGVTEQGKRKAAYADKLLTYQLRLVDGVLVVQVEVAGTTSGPQSFIVYDPDVAVQGSGKLGRPGSYRLRLGDYGLVSLSDRFAFANSRKVPLPLVLRNASAGLPPVGVFRQDAQRRVTLTNLNGFQATIGAPAAESGTVNAAAPTLGEIRISAGKPLDVPAKRWRGWKKYELVDVARDGGPPLRHAKLTAAHSPAYTKLFPLDTPPRLRTALRW